MPKKSLCGIDSIPVTYKIRARVVRFKPFVRLTMLSWTVSILIVAILAIVVGFSGLRESPAWVVRGLCILVLILCIVAAVLA
jgi:uncharacterized membrane protein YtjA (UPF0391 family)